jgi:hypothetical protein
MSRIWAFQFSRAPPTGNVRGARCPKVTGRTPKIESRKCSTQQPVRFAGEPVLFEEITITMSKTGYYFLCATFSQPGRMGYQGNI